MNTIVRALPHQRFASHKHTRQIATRQMLQIAVLVIVVLINAFAVVYIKDVYRRTFINYQEMQNAQNQLYVDWGKLLLEQSTWSTQSRVQRVAEQRLNMEVPSASSVVMIQQ
jgi:cell division protein FtsL